MAGWGDQEWGSSLWGGGDYPYNPIDISYVSVRYTPTFAASIRYTPSFAASPAYKPSIAKSVRYIPSLPEGGRFSQVGPKNVTYVPSYARTGSP